jgi:hypothetical protein
MRLSREQVDQWPIGEAGLAPRVARRLAAAGITDVGALRARTGAKIPRCGRATRQHIAEFFERVDRNIDGTPLPANVRAWLAEFLTPGEQFVVTQRFGLEDMLFRPTMKWRTLREIGADAPGGLTRERVRQVLVRARGKLRSRIARAAAMELVAACQAQIEASGGFVTTAELVAWRGAAWLGGVQPWGVLLLLSETVGEPTWRHDYFSTMTETALGELEARLVEMVSRATGPLSPEQIAEGINTRTILVVLGRHPSVDMRTDGRFCWAVNKSRANASNPFSATRPCFEFFCGGGWRIC